MGQLKATAAAVLVT